MANIKSQKKRILTNEQSRQRNVHVRSRMKTIIKMAETAIAENNTEAIPGAVNKALSEVDRAVKKGVIHQNSAARKKAHLQHTAAVALKG